MNRQEDKVATWHRNLSPLLPISPYRSASSTVGVEIAARCHAGKVKPFNEDNYLVVRLGRYQEIVSSSLSAAELPDRFAEHAYVMVVADGIGGAGSGGVASRLALTTFAQLALHFGKWNVRVDPAIAEDIINHIEWYYGRVQDAITHHSLTEPGLSTMATAVTAAYSAGDDLFIAHVGHSRAYLYREGELTAITRDHTLASKRRPGPTPVEHVTDDLHHILTHALGGAFSSPGVDVEHFRLMHGDCLVLCTNGLTDLVSDKQIADVLLGRRNADEQCRTLVDLAVEAGGTDNITVLLAQYNIPRD
jgi:serine/threonine protein phosphatase PrpC